MTTPHKRIFTLAFAVGGLAAAVSLAACGSDTDNRPAAWSYISPAIFQPNCATSSCHSRAAAVAGLDFSTTADGYISLTDLHVQYGSDTGVVKATRELVTPFHPDSSRVVNMLRARDTKRMPPDRPLAEGDIELVERWILEGAENN